KKLLLVLLKVGSRYMNLLNSAFQRPSWLCHVQRRSTYGTVSTRRRHHFGEPERHGGQMGRPREDAEAGDPGDGNGHRRGEAGSSPGHGHRKAGAEESGGQRAPG